MFLYIHTCGLIYADQFISRSGNRSSRSRPSGSIKSEASSQESRRSRSRSLSKTLRSQRSTSGPHKYRSKSSGKSASKKRKSGSQLVSNHRRNSRPVFTAPESWLVISKAETETDSEDFTLVHILFYKLSLTCGGCTY